MDAVTILRISNGWAIYPNGSTGYDMSNDSRFKPLMVFNAKGDLLRWLDKDWRPEDGNTADSEE